MLPVTIWESWLQVRSVWEPSHIDTEDEGEDNDQDCKNQKEMSEEKEDSEELLEDREEDSLEAPTVIQKPLYPSLGSGLKSHSLPPTSRLPPPLPQSVQAKEWESLKKPPRANNRLISAARAPLPPAGDPHTSLSAVEGGLRHARLEGDLDALNFPVIIREHVAPNDEHPNGVHVLIYMNHFLLNCLRN